MTDIIRKTAPNRTDITQKIIKLLESQINCQNIMEFLDKNKAEEGKLRVRNNVMQFSIIYYNDRDNIITIQDHDITFDSLTHIFDFMVEANYSGYEYFPNIYGVLNCLDGSNSKIYIFYEAFDGDLIKLLQEIGHASEWYDIAFQIAIINYYMVSINKYTYLDAGPENHLYRKLSHSIYQNYSVGSYNFKINRKFIIVLWDLYQIKPWEEEYRNTTNIHLLLQYINEHKDKISIPPSARILKMLNEVQNDIENTPAILNSYYNSGPPTVSDQSSMSFQI